jgi:Rrf2 family protein
MSKLVNISEATSIAIHSLAIIAGSEKLVNAGLVAEKTGYSRNHIAKVLQTLARQNYVNSERGPAGGFRLAKVPESINLLEIYELFDGKAEVHQCGIHFEKCKLDECVFGDVVTTVSRDFIEYFKNRTIKDLISKQK